MKFYDKPNRFGLPTSFLLTTLFICLPAGWLMRPLITIWAGDAVIHLRVAELLAQGQGFQFNVGQNVVATSSLLWTILLAALFDLFDPATVAWIVKLINLFTWYATVLFMMALWSKLYRDPLVGMLSAGLYAFNPGVFQNSLNGMEAILLALQLLMLFFIFFGGTDRWRRLPIVAVLATTTSLTRPEGALFCLLLAIFLLWQKRTLERTTLALLMGASLAFASTLLVNLSVSGSLLPDSGAARAAAGLRESILLGPIHIHPSSLIRFAAYWPITSGMLLMLPFAIRGQSHLFNNLMATYTLQRAIRFSFLLFASMLIFYTFVLGATHTSRYWLPFWPFVMGMGAGGLVKLGRYWASSRKLVVLTVIVSFGWMSTVYTFESQERLKKLRYPHQLIVKAVQNRAQFTSELIERLGATSNLPIKIAMQEVQLRYFLLDDGSIEILSLDGRTANDFRPYINPRTGMRHLDRYLREKQPDFVFLHGQYYPTEPVLPTLREKWEQGTKEIEIEGFHFIRVDIPGIDVARYLYDN